MPHICRNHILPCNGILPHIPCLPGTVRAPPNDTQLLNSCSSTNQTTLENISPFLILRHLPPLPLQGNEHSMLSDPPKDHELSYKQRRLVKDAHGMLRMYDVGWRRNVGQVFGWGGVPYGWLWRVWYGGSRSVESLFRSLAITSTHSPGDGRQFPRNPKTDEVLGRLAGELAKAEVARRS